MSTYRVALALLLLAGLALCGVASVLAARADLRAREMRIEDTFTHAETDPENYDRSQK